MKKNIKMFYENLKEAVKAVKEFKDENVKLILYSVDSDAIDNYDINNFIKNYLDLYFK